jgi:hypothetical protein
MKRLIVAFVLCAAIGLGLWLARSPDAAPPSVDSPVQQQHPGTLAVKSDGPAIFKKVLWRAPLPEDKILNAERREWSEGPDLNHWQWFLQVEAGKALSDYLRVANAFGLRPAASPEIPHAPEWFPTDLTGYEVQRAGALTFFFHKTSNEFYATSQGKGFTKALPIMPAAPPPTGPQPQSRIPVTPPPVPQE